MINLRGNCRDAFELVFVAEASAFWNSLLSPERVLIFANTFTILLVRIVLILSSSKRMIGLHHHLSIQRISEYVLKGIIVVLDRQENHEMEQYMVDLAIDRST